MILTIGLIVFITAILGIVGAWIGSKKVLFAVSCFEFLINILLFYFYLLLNIVCHFISHY
jgi:hypothetical protein